MSATIATAKSPESKRVSITESNVRKAGGRLLTVKLVSTEIAYVQRVLGSSATQEKLDAAVLQVRSLPWSDIVVPE